MGQSETLFVTALSLAAVVGFFLFENPRLLRDAEPGDLHRLNGARGDQEPFDAVTLRLARQAVIDEFLLQGGARRVYLIGFVFRGNRNHVAC